MLKSMVGLGVLALASAVFALQGVESPQSRSCSGTSDAAPCSKECGTNGGTACSGGACSGQLADIPVPTSPISASHGPCCEGSACGSAASKDCPSCPAAGAKLVSKQLERACCPSLVSKEANGSCCASTVSKNTGGSCCASDRCSKTACSGNCGPDCKDCPVTLAMKRLPEMTFAVGDKKTPCSKTAAKMAKESSEPVRFVVGDKTYDKKGEALTALAESTEQFVAAFVEPKVCKTSGTVTVAGKKLHCPDKAANCAKVAKSAMDHVQMTFLIGKEKCDCPITADKLAKESGKAKLFVVGKETTPCSVTARLNLARAKYKAAVVALMQADAKPTPNDQAGT